MVVGIVHQAQPRGGVENLELAIANSIVGESGDGRDVRDSANKYAVIRDV